MGGLGGNGGEREEVGWDEHVEDGGWVRGEKGLVGFVEVLSERTAVLLLLLALFVGRYSLCVGLHLRGGPIGWLLLLSQ